MQLAQIVWGISLIAEFGLFLKMLTRTWRRMYPAFLLYLLIDLCASGALFWIEQVSPQDYYVPWLVTQMLLVVGRLGLVIECYQKLSDIDSRWFFPVGIAISTSVGSVLLLHILMEGSLRWPGSLLEPVFGVLATSNALLGFIVCAVLMTAHTHKLQHTLHYKHTAVLCAYLLLTSACYYTASHKIEQISVALMIIATICYLSWLACSIASGLSGNISRNRAK